MVFRQVGWGGVLALALLGRALGGLAGVLAAARNRRNLTGVSTFIS
jgi:hypothetical protein